MTLNPGQILASTILIGLFLLIIGLTGAVTVIQKFTPKSTIRGVQLSTGVLLITGGVKMIVGISTFQKLHNLAEPYLSRQLALSPSVSCWGLAPESSRSF